MKPIIENEYSLPFKASSILASNGDALVVYGSENYRGREYKLAILRNGEVKILDYKFPSRSLEGIGQQDPATIFKVDNGFGLALSDEFVFFDYAGSYQARIPFKSCLIDDLSSHYNSNRIIRYVPKRVTKLNHETYALLLPDYSISDSNVGVRVKIGKVIEKGIFGMKFGKGAKHIRFDDVDYSIKFDESHPIEFEGQECKWPFVISDISFNSNTLYYHTTGTKSNYGKWGMKYCRLGTFDPDGSHHIRRDVEHGPALFSADGNYLITRSLRSPLTLYIKNIEKLEEYSFRLTPKRVLGSVYKYLDKFDLLNRRLWLSHDRNVTELSLDL